MREKKNHRKHSFYPSILNSAYGPPDVHLHGSRRKASTSKAPAAATLRPPAVTFYAGSIEKATARWPRSGRHSRMHHISLFRTAKEMLEDLKSEALYTAVIGPLPKGFIA